MAQSIVPAASAESFARIISNIAGYQIGRVGIFTMGPSLSVSVHRHGQFGWTLARLGDEDQVLQTVAIRPGAERSYEVVRYDRPGPPVTVAETHRALTAVSDALTELIGE